MARPFSAARFVFDAAIGAVVFAGLTVALLGQSAAAQLITKGTAPLPLATLTSSPQALILLLAIVFSALFALNLAFMRHVKGSEVRVKAHRRPDTDQAD